ncbi:MAG: RNA-directed DNA polymerase [Bacilli bacterium]|nr:RNA-directed DNA polymerase [Bacilli bacterium]
MYKAYLECYKNKKKSPGAMEFLFNYQKNIRKLLYEVNSRTYTPSLSTVFIIKDPKIREVFAAHFRDRIIHHLLIKELLPLFQEYFIENSFSCMPGRGTLAGVLKMAEYMDIVPKDWYVMKMDVSSFFMGIRKSWLASRLESFIRENYRDKRKLEDLVWLCNIIVLTDPTQNCIRVGEYIELPPGKSLFGLSYDKGLPIGNYSSQMFANFYMTPLDYFITQELGIWWYGRYVDDFIMYGPKEQLLQAAPLIREFARKELDLTISESKFYLQPINHGVKFVGSMIMPGRIYCGNRVRGELEKKIHKEFPDPKRLDHSLSVFNSYLGLIKHYSSYNIRRDLLCNLPNGWDIYFKPSKDYSKLILAT